MRRGHDGPVTSIAFSPDGKAIASASRDRIIVVPTTPALAEMVCERTFRNLSQNEWNELVGPDVPYERDLRQLAAWPWRPELISDRLQADHSAETNARFPATPREKQDVALRSNPTRGGPDITRPARS